MLEDDLSKHEEVARSETRDDKGQFVHAEQPQSPKSSQEHRNPIASFLSEHTAYSKNQDDILDVHIGNPLHKIVLLLQDIKKQKAFNFTLKGSLGIMGVFLALSVFGIFGGGKMLCDKGTQTQIGVLKTLRVTDQETSGIPVLSEIINYFTAPIVRNRNVIIKNNGEVIQIPYSQGVNLTRFMNNTIMATGNYDSCGQTLTVKDQTGIEFLR